MNQVSIFTARPETAVSIMLGSGKVTDRKMGALSLAGEAGVKAISYGHGSVAKAAREIGREQDMQRIVESVGLHGNFHDFAVTFAAFTGESVKFGLKGADGKWIRKPSQDFREFGAVLRMKLATLEDKGKDLTNKGTHTAAYADLMYLEGIHSAACAVMDEQARKDRERAEQHRAAIASDVIDAEIKQLMDAAGVPTAH